MVAPFVFPGEERGGMKHWEAFKNFKQRGEWVELQFMAQAAQHGFSVSKPWGDTLAYDVGIEYQSNFLRVQVKSTTARSGAGYRCQFMPNHLKKHDYSLDEIDLFAAYVIPEDAWYLIPAVLLLGKRRKCMAMLHPVVRPAKRASYCYEGYREAWNLLKKSRTELLDPERDVTSIRPRSGFSPKVHLHDSLDGIFLIGNNTSWIGRLNSRTSSKAGGIRSRRMSRSRSAQRSNFWKSTGRRCLDPTPT